MFLKMKFNSDNKEKKDFFKKKLMTNNPNNYKKNGKTF